MRVPGGWIHDGISAVASVFFFIILPSNKNKKNKKKNGSSRKNVFGKNISHITSLTWLSIFFDITQSVL